MEMLFPGVSEVILKGTAQPTVTLGNNLHVISHMSHLIIKTKKSPPKKKLDRDF